MCVLLVLNVYTNLCYNLGNKSEVVPKFFFNIISLKRYTFMQGYVLLLILYSFSLFLLSSLGSSDYTKQIVYSTVCLTALCTLKYINIQVNRLNEPKHLCFGKQSLLTCYFRKSLVLLSMRSAVLLYIPKIDIIKLLNY